MWEFSLIINSNKSEIAKQIFNSLKRKASGLKSLITCYEEYGKISVLYACEELDKLKSSYLIASEICRVICTQYKQEFLKQNLRTNNKNELENYIFEKALVNFDRETDRYIVNRHLIIDKTLDLDSFFHFKLQTLREKWTELVKIANDNSTYFLSEDSFVELLKFLIENIEICQNEVNVIIKDGNILLLDGEYQNLLPNKSLDKCELINMLLELSPQIINWQSDEEAGIIEKVFEKRIKYCAEAANLQNILDKTIKLV